MADSDTVRRDLGELLGRDALRWDDESLTAHAHDTWSLSLLRLMRGRLRERPACVVSPADTEAVAKVLRYANQHSLPVVPYGAGSGVCGGVLPDGGAVVLDLRSMNRLLEMNPIALMTRVQAGMMGNDLESALGAEGFSCGHFPQSIDISTVGGWIATRSAGQFSTRYGSIEDALVALEVVLPDGAVIRTRPVPRASTGPDLRQIFLGSEGTLGVVTEATLRILPKPESRRMASYRFGDMKAGLEAIRTFVREGWRPPVVRLYDAAETARNFPNVNAGDGCLLLLLSEGPPSLVDVEIVGCEAWCSRAGGASLGDDAVKDWLEHRNTVPGFETFLERGLVLDTIEVAAAWDRIGAMYDGVVSALQAIPGVMVASGHSSHSYLTGTNIYFTFVAKPESDNEAEALYIKCWDVTMEQTSRCGGTIAHHHGIGRVRREWMPREHGKALDVLRAVKRALDPGGIMNPGVLLPP